MRLRDTDDVRSGRVKSALYILAKEPCILVKEPYIVLRPYSRNTDVVRSGRLIYKT